MYRIGIDPGAASGALALLKEDYSFVEVVDMPTELNGKHQEINAAELGKILTRWKQKGTVVAFLEAVHSMPKQGIASAFGFGDSFGCIRGSVGALLIPLIRVSPQQWKKRAGLIGTDKDRARTVAQQLYPEAELGRKKDIGRADALLIARFGANALTEMALENAKTQELKRS
jgi:crossover junction endodeoxyribonuclease RuvC